MKFIAWVGTAVAGILLAGCSSVLPEETYPVKLTVPELEGKMSKAVDPDARYRGAKSFILRQMVRTEHFLDDDQETLVDLKFEKPDKFKLTRLEDNKPQYSIVYDGKFGYVADYRRKKVIELEQTKLQQIKLLALLASPQTSLSKVFRKIELSGCRLDGKEYYLLTCYWDDPKQPPMKLYVDAQTFLIRRNEAEFKVGGTRVSSKTAILDYELRDGVMVPHKSQSEESGGNSTGTVIYFKLDPIFATHEFQPPMFDRK